MRNLLVSLFLLPAILAVQCVVMGEGLSWISLVNVALFPVVMLGSIALHEAGHALVARAVGLQVLRVELGVGRSVWNRKLGGTLVVLNTFPTLGVTYIGASSERALRPRWWLTILGGPAVTAALVWGLWPSTTFARGLVEALLPLEAFGYRLAVRELLLFFNLWVLFINLVPLQVVLRSQGLVNDGSRLFAIPFASQDEVRTLLEMPVIIETGERIEQRDFAGARALVDDALARHPTSVNVRNTLGLLQLAVGEHAEAHATFLELLRATPPNGAAYWFLRNNVAWTSFLLRRDELRADADRHSAAVHGRHPHAPPIMNTRGAVLVWLGRAAEAIPLLERAFTTTSAPSSRASVAFVLVLAHAQLGEYEKAATWLTRAEANDPDGHSPLREEARASLTPPRQEAADSGMDLAASR
ncbi:tetratricopeptide repeat protein [Myxococcus stipitatus]|uniref:tetratricopeptide repeat protein n=1 Tax=Myxococcus stipitatus TaxID=83455 RepID=UPI001F3AF8D6|nr:tetratricopeptide repeat protein [Myxococcus stipitatus]MCE9667294.1 tetratricopeptide repeat protein [Myxococcus stipitatus]